MSGVCNERGGGSQKDCQGTFNLHVVTASTFRALPPGKTCREKLKGLGGVIDVNLPRALKREFSVEDLA